MKKRYILSVGALALALAGMAAVAAPASAHGPGGFGRGMMGLGRGGERGTLLAQELGITVDQLQTAQTKAMEKSLAAAVTAGRLTQAQADLMLAGRKLQLAIDQDAVMAKALGLSVADLQAARDAGKTLRDLLTQQKLDRQTFETNLKAAMDAAVAQAVKDGVITQAQADALKAAEQNHFGRGMRGGHGRMGDSPIRPDTQSAPAPSGDGTVSPGTQIAPAPSGAGL
jgi:hypothetical protein